MTTVTVQALQKLRQKSWEGTPEEESFEATSENRHRGCRYDTFGHLLIHNSIITIKMQFVTIIIWSAYAQTYIVLHSNTLTVLNC